MNIVGLLRLLVMRADFREPEKRDALKLLDELDKINAFGTLATMTTGKHTFTPFRVYPTDYKGNPVGNSYIVCKLCGKARH
jgi:hypothetical protein